nr:MAG TPA: hypothetical protein [Caudoviricetes sp.]
MWNQVVSESGSPTTEWVFDMDGYTWVGDMLVYEEDLADGYEMELVEYVM